MKSIFQNFFKKLTLGIFGLLISVLILEGAVRLLFPHPQYRNFIVPEVNVGFIAEPKGICRYRNAFSEFDVQLKMNREGFRDVDHPIEKAPDTYRIAILGDSFTFAEQVEEHEMWVTQLEKLLNANKPDMPAKHIEVMNFAISGYDTQQELLCYQTYVRKYKPDLVLLAVYVHNDFSGNLFYQYENNFGRPYFRLDDGKLEKIPADMEKLSRNYEQALRLDTWHWYNRSHLANLVADLGGHVLHRITSKLHGKRTGSDASKPENLDDFWIKNGIGRYRYYSINEKDPYPSQVDEITRLLMQQLEAAVESDGARFCVSIFPAKEHVWPERWDKIAKSLPSLDKFRMDFDRPFERTREFLPKLAARNDILDTRPFLKEADTQKPVFFQHDFHFTPWGQQVVAEAQAKWLAGQLEKIGAQASNK